MSTKLEDLPDDNSDIHEEDEVLGQAISDIMSDSESDSNPDVYSEEVIAKTSFFDKLRDPLIASLLMFILSNPLLLKGLHRIPGLDSTSSIVINVILSLIAGVLFFLIREFF